MSDKVETVDIQIFVDNSAYNCEKHSLTLVERDALLVNLTTMVPPPVVIQAGNKTVYYLGNHAIKKVVIEKPSVPRPDINPTVGPVQTITPPEGMTSPVQTKTTTVSTAITWDSSTGQKATDASPLEKTYMSQTGNCYASYNKLDALFDSMRRYMKKGDYPAILLIMPTATSLVEAHTKAYEDFDPEAELLVIKAELYLGLDRVVEAQEVLTRLVSVFPESISDYEPLLNKAKEMMEPKVIPLVDDDSLSELYCCG